MAGFTSSGFTETGFVVGGIGEGGLYERVDAITTTPQTLCPVAVAWYDRWKVVNTGSKTVYLADLNRSDTLSGTTVELIDKADTFLEPTDYAWLMGCWQFVCASDDGPTGEISQDTKLVV